MCPRAVVVGGGRVGGALGRLLIDGGHETTLLDHRPHVVARLRTELGSPVVEEGDVTDPAALERAGVRGADVVAAVTAVDEQNLVVACLARDHFSVPRTVARIVDPARAWMYTPAMGVDVALNQADLIAHMVVEELALGDMTMLLKLRRGRYALVEERLDPTAAVVGRRLADLKLPRECVVVAVLRDGQPMLHDPATILKGEDEVLAVVHMDAARELSALLGHAGPESFRAGGLPARES